MSDIIQLLPDNIANQIAAGEVVQRPASAVKELLENALDAGADKIQLIIKDAGKALIQVIDNGCGMSVTDARMCFERHATSKIRKSEDLFAIRTMGFRGEAMASIAAIAQVELKTKPHDFEIGTLIQIDGSTLIKQEPVACASGTSITVKNLFFNTPARRNFLKSNPTEMRYIIDEFQRVALAKPHIAFSLHHDGDEIYRLPAANIKQRIVHLFGTNYNERLIPVEEDTTIINLKGYVGKPEFAKKVRGEQFFFMNGRFVKDAYLNHAITKAYDELLPKDQFPFYILFIDIDPARIDINVHPTKTEVKYLDDKAIYAIIHSAVKRSLGRFNISPSLGFNQETAFDNMITPLAPEDIKPPSIKFDPNFNPFGENKTSQRANSAFRNFSNGAEPSKNWASLYELTQHTPDIQQEISLDENRREPEVQERVGLQQYIQIHNRYIISQIKSGMLIIDQQAAHERILYERFLQRLDDRKGASQQSLFPQTVSLNASDFELAKSLLDNLRSLGFDIREFGKNTLIIDGIPVDLGNSKVNESQLLENLLEEYKNSQQNFVLSEREALARSMAKNGAIKGGRALSVEEINNLIDELFACQSPNLAINGKPAVQTVSLAELAQKFEKRI
jgi:DNA mismatch repair protein MutL